MHIFWAATAAALLVCGAARADGPAQPPEKGDAAVGVGIICNTPQQAEQFVGFRKKGAAPERAMRAVNAIARDQRACGVAAVAYIRDTTVDTMNSVPRTISNAIPRSLECRKSGRCFRGTAHTWSKAFWAA